MEKVWDQILGGQAAKEEAVLVQPVLMTLNLFPYPMPTTTVLFCIDLFFTLKVTGKGVTKCYMPSSNALMTSYLRGNCKGGIKAKTLEQT